MIATPGSTPDARPSLDEGMLEDYLNQHLLGSRPGVPSFRAAADTWKDTPHEAVLRGIADDVESSQRTLTSIITRLGFSTPVTHRAMGAIAAVGGRANPVNAVRSKGSGWTQVELEILTGALRAQSEMWRLLENLAPYHPGLDADEAHERYTATLAHVQELQQVIDATLLDRFLDHRDPEARRR